ncbi:MAG TPA: type II toxin-antitoxin system VapC family toxin [Steroidobacteraceae bacterium]|nr:type II toxin-antitoxin system VapC family toxin [Steroidobacteraceae bacterium]
MTVIIDASIVIKWLLQDPEREAGTDRATNLMDAVLKGEQPVVQPTHWILEVAAVLARESPATAADDVMMLQALELPEIDEPLVLRRAVELAIGLKQHLFDTFYHALALETPSGILITADDRYLHAARKKGQIMHLMDWQSPQVD